MKVNFIFIILIKMADSFFSGFTNVYPIQKTLRRELKPIGETLELMKKSNVLSKDIQRDEDYQLLQDAENILSKDIQRDEDYQLIKPLFDKLHDRFIFESMDNVEGIDWDDFVVFYNAYKAKLKGASLTDKEKKGLQEEFITRLKKLREEVVKSYGKTAEKRGANPTWIDEKGKALLTEKGYKILTEKNILKVLEIEYKEDKELSEIIKRFSGFFSYFIGFNQNRENYYDKEDKSTAVANRVVNENLLTFATNCSLKEQIQQVDGITDKELSIFDGNFYNNCLHQQGIDSYNTVVGGEKNEEGVRTTDGINVKINLHNQKHKTRIPQLKKLHKQIGSMKAKTVPFTLIEDDSDLEKTLQQLVSEAIDKNKQIIELVSQIWENKIEDFDKIWISKAALSFLSNMFFANWHIIQEKGVEHKIFSYKKNDDEPYKIPNYISLAQLKSILEAVEISESGIDTDQQEILFKRYMEFDKEGNSLRNGIENNWEYFLVLLKRYFESLLEKDAQLVDQQGQKFRVLGFRNAYDLLKPHLGSIDKNDKEQKNYIKSLADSALSIMRFLKLFKINPDKIDGEFDTTFYNRMDEILADYLVNKWYDAIRNYLTKKPFSEEKIKLNFNTPTLLAGWDKNKETQNLGVLLKNNDGFYLAIPDKKNNKFFENESLFNTVGDDTSWQKMDYKLLPGPNKMLPKCLMPGKDRKKYGADDEVLRLYDEGEFKKGDGFQKKSLEKLIDFYKIGLAKYEDRGVFDFQFSPTENYQDISQFYSDVEKQGYKISWRNINNKLLDEGVKSGKLYLFKINSKDFSGSDATPDLQTLYWKSIFGGDTNIKLNGEAEVFRRNKSIDKEKKHLKYDNYDVYKNNRYTEDKIFFHVPITLGFGNKQQGKFNEKLNKEVLIPNYNDLHIIGIDRGEKHLAFYSVISAKTGKIVEQGTLNFVNGINYEEKLSNMAKTRLAARQNWDTIGNIKNLKDGYISHVVKKIVDLVIKYNAIVVFEDLNSGFKRGRQKIEQSVYQKLELALMKKLNYMVDKKIALGEPGSVTKAYQLAPQVNTFGDIKGKQWGIVFYTRANYTSTTDPVTGWRKGIYIKAGDLKTVKKELSPFRIIYNEKKKAYAISYDKRTMRSDVDRWRGKKNAHGQWEVVFYNPTEELQKLFDKYKIDITQDILDQANKMELPLAFYTKLVRILNLVMQIRNTDNKGNDFIQSPIEHDGEKFDSRVWYEQCRNKEGKIYETENKLPYPTSGDANGAYNIARKGRMMLERIVINPEKPDLFIKDSDWNI